MSASERIRLFIDPSPVTILVVEDEVLIRLVIADYLRECGFKVLEAANAAEAIQILSTADASIEVVFSDIQMPGEMDGFGLARWVRGNKPNSKMILTSGYNRSAQIAGELCEGHPILAKPYESSTVVDRIKRLLAQLPDEL